MGRRVGWDGVRGWNGGRVEVLGRGIGSGVESVG